MNDILLGSRFWECSGSALGVLWGCFGVALGILEHTEGTAQNRFLTELTTLQPSQSDPEPTLDPPPPPYYVEGGAGVSLGVCHPVFWNSPLLRDTIFTNSRKTPAETFDDFCKQGPVLSKVCPGVFFWGLGGHPRPLWGTPRNTFANTTDDRRQTTDDRRQLTGDS